MWTLFTDRGRLGAATALLAALVLSGCASKGGLGLEGSGEGGTSKYEQQKDGGAAADSDAIHIPPVPHDPKVEKIAEQAMAEYARALQARIAASPGDVSLTE